MLCTLALIIAVDGPRELKNTIISLGISVSYSTAACSMYLMLDHNHGQYLQVIKIFYKLRLHWICCCCCKYVISDQMDEFTEEKSIGSSVINGVKIDSTMDTRDISKDQRINAFELSEATEMI